MADIDGTGDRKRPPPWWAAVELAIRQHGAVTRLQLLATGMTPDVIRAHLKAGRLHAKHRGVYAVGHPAITDFGVIRAAVLACGPHAVLSHFSAAMLWGFYDYPINGRVHVLVPRSKCRGHAGIALHHTRFLPQRDRSEVASIPVTSVARTLRDLASMASGYRFRKAFEEADRCHLVDRNEINEILERSNGHRGVWQLRAQVQSHRLETPRTRSRFEYRFFRNWEATGLEPPEMNARVEGFEVDCLWRRHRLIVELDDPAFHDTPDQAEFDRRKSVKLELAGYRVHRYSPDFFYGQTTRMLREVAELLRLRALEIGIATEVADT